MIWSFFYDCKTNYLEVIFFAQAKKKISSECECLVLTQYDDLKIYVIWKKIVILLKIKKVTRALEVNF